MRLQTKQAHRKDCKRYNFPGHCHELTFSCYRRQPFLGFEQSRIFLSEAIKKAQLKHSFTVWAYVFMPEHVHLLIYPLKKEYSISSILLSIKQPVSRRMKQYAQTEKPKLLKLTTTGLKSSPFRFWQAGGGYDRNITNIDTAINVIRYIHNNPLRRKLVKHPKEWLYSSYKDWENDEKGPIAIDKSLSRKQTRPNGV